MEYTSTRNNTLRETASFAIANGISKEGGLFVPTTIPQVDADFIASLAKKTYIEQARDVLSLFLTDYPAAELAAATEGAYTGRFGSEAVAPVVPLTGNTYVLELFRGPTCAFKDMALQLLPYLLTGAAKRVSDGKETVILVATSGDTGKAALEGFKDVPGTKILVFFPSDGVSPMQKLQMTTQEGANVGVCAIKGNFDDAQTGVKAIFTDPAVRETLARHNMQFSSANSINWGRLVPQIVYYFSAYAGLLAAGKIRNGDKVNFCVPTGNFGNILAAYYAKEMGLPVNKLICASNENDVLTEFLTTGRYNRVRPFHTTVSPSMDILISSNLERLLFHLAGNDSEKTKALFAALAKTGEYTVDGTMLSAIRALFAAGSANDAGTKETIRDTFEKTGYLCDTHTAVAIRVYNEYCAKTGDGTPTVIASTASPYKFSRAVLGALTNESLPSDDEFETLSALEAKTGVKAPENLRTLRGKTPRFTDVCTQAEMEEKVFGLLGVR
ncbi:MAG: threonine synthase [Clostridia bacterium]|nr:threonine synthase [Clostridia bacterium]